MNEATRCSVCGRMLIAGRCISCDTLRWSRFVHRELVLLTALIGVTAVAFVGTRTLARTAQETPAASSRRACSSAP
ncbi:MAG: hypothetical protein HY654_14525 [Acidobacteria bacterium]|nr:hypothetical protein [Acidobacteriota bacterium]